MLLDVENLISDKEIRNLSLIGLKPEGVKTVSLDKLYIQFRSEWPLQEPTSNPKAKKGIRLIDSPFVSLLEEYEEKGESILEFPKIKNTACYKMWDSFNQIGFRFDWYDYPKKLKKNFSGKVIQTKIQRLVGVYNSIRQFGYRKGAFERRMIIVLPEPFEKLRLGFEHQIDGYEIWSGHHRAAALSVLKYQEVDVLFLAPIKNK